MLVSHITNCIVTQSKVFCQCWISFLSTVIIIYVKAGKSGGRMYERTGLRGQYIQVKRKRSGEITFGGDQGFFAGAPMRSADERKQKQGCGITALANTFLYLAG